MKPTKMCSRVATCVAAVVIATGAAGCFAQSGEQALNCEELRNVLTQTTADLSAAMERVTTDPQGMAGEIGEVAGRLKQEAGKLSDEELRSAMTALADELERLSTAGVGGAGASMPSPPDVARLSQVLERKCPV